MEMDVQMLNLKEFYDVSLYAKNTLKWVDRIYTEGIYTKGDCSLVETYFWRFPGVFT